MQKVRACFLLSGWTRDNIPRHVVQVVDGSCLEDAKSQLSVVTALHVYSVQPSDLKDADKLQNSDYGQTGELFRKMLDSGADPCPAAKRDASTDRPAAKKPPPTTIVGQSKPAAKPSAKTAAPGLSGPKPSSFATSSKTVKDAKPKPTTTTTAAAGSSRMKPSETKKPDSAPKKLSSQAAVVKDDDDEEMPAVSRPAKGKRVTIDDSESEDEEPAPKQPKIDKKNSASASKSSKAGAGSAATGKKQPAGNKRKAPADKQEQQENEEEKKPSAPSPNYGTVKVHADAPGVKRTRRVMKTYFNDAGEEVTGKKFLCIFLIFT